jgi:glyceraldehyde-3-phosphate dehydrogenase (NADP+)
MDVKYMDAPLADDRVAMISFTGSAAVGWDLKQRAGKKTVVLELGGNAPVIVDSSADLESSASKCVTGAFAYSGQVCISIQRIYVQEKIFDQWTEKFVSGAKSLKAGDPLDRSTQLSVMIDERAAVRVEAWVKEAVDNGAHRLLDGERKGSMLLPTVLTRTDPEMRIVAEEAFGPVAVVEKYSQFDEAVAMANHSKYGLQAGVFTEDLAKAQYAAEHLEYGGVIINDSPTFRVDHMPYGGSKDSGFGREGVRYAMDEMTEQRIIVVNS